MKTIFVTLLMASSAYYVYAQNPDSIPHPDAIVIKKQVPQSDLLKNAIMKIIGKHLDSELLQNTPKNFAYITSAGVVMNTNGEIDTVYFPEKMPDDLKKIIKPGPELIGKLKKIPRKYSDFKGKIVVFPILYKRSQDASLDYRSSFGIGLENLWPNFDYKDQKKQIVLLTPYINRFGTIYN